MAEGQSIATFSSRKLLRISCLIFILITTQAYAQTNLIYRYCLNEYGNYTANNNNNFSTAMSIFLLSSKNGDKTLHNSSYGQTYDEVYESGLCRGDIAPIACRSCLNHSAHLLAEICPNNNSAIAWSEECMLRYSNHSSFGLVETHPRFSSWNTENIEPKQAATFFHGLRTLLDDLKNRAAVGGSLRKYATGNISVPTSFRTIYALVQCMPDLPPLGCIKCLNDVFEDVKRYYVRAGGRVVTPSCNFRFENYLFYEHHPYDVPATPFSPPLELLSKSKARKSYIFESGIISVATVASVILIIFVGVYKRVLKGNKRVEVSSSSEASEEFEIPRCLRFDFSTIRIATDNFSEKNKIGLNKVSSVYRGRLSNGQKISVKKFRGDNSCYQNYFMNEVNLAAKLQHRNLAKLLGFCLTGSERFIVYEFVTTSLDLLIFEDRVEAKHIQLSWDKRRNIIKGIARGLLYLHEDSGFAIIHRDIGADKIFLDEELNPKIFAFGRALVFGGVDQSEETSNLTQTLNSSKAHIASDLFHGGLISNKTDVFSFGVLLLEMMAGCENRFPYQDDFEIYSVISKVWRNWREGTSLDVINPQIKDGFESEIKRWINIGLLCVQENKDDRPTINTVFQMLNCKCYPVPADPSKPGYFCEISTGGFNDKSNSHSKNEFEASTSESSQKNPQL